MPADPQQLRSLLSAYLDGELTETQRAEVEAYLDSDPDARRLLEELRATAAALSNLPRARPSDEFTTALRARIERHALLGAEPPRRTPQLGAPMSFARRLAAAAMITLAVTAGYLTWSLTRQAPPPTPHYAMRDTSAVQKELPAKSAPEAAPQGDRFAAAGERAGKAPSADGEESRLFRRDTPPLAAAPAAPSPPAAETVPVRSRHEDSNTLAMARAVRQSAADDKLELARRGKSGPREKAFADLYQYGMVTTGPVEERGQPADRAAGVAVLPVLGPQVMDAIGAAGTSAPAGVSVADSGEGVPQPTVFYITRHARMGSAAASRAASAPAATAPAGTTQPASRPHPPSRPATDPTR